MALNTVSPAASNAGRPHRSGSAVPAVVGVPLRSLAALLLLALLMPKIAEACMIMCAPGCDCGYVCQSGMCCDPTWWNRCQTFGSGCQCSVCKPGFYVTPGSSDCEPKKANGATCTYVQECTSNQCGSGTCGSAAKPNGGTCPNNDWCTSGICTAGRCCANSNCITCTTGVCTSCTASRYLSGGQCFADQPNGGSCTTDDWCVSNICTGGVCCEYSNCLTCTTGKCTSCAHPLFLRTHESTCNTPTVTVTRTSTLSTSASSTASLSLPPPPTRSRSFSRTVSVSPSNSPTRSGLTQSATLTWAASPPPSVSVSTTITASGSMTLSASASSSATILTVTSSLLRQPTPSLVGSVTHTESRSATGFLSESSALQQRASATTTAFGQLQVTRTTPALSAAALPPPLPVAAVDVAVVADGAAAASSTAVSAVSLNPAVGTQPAKLSVLRDLIDCGADASQQPDAPPVTTHPLRFAVDAAGAAERYNAGIVLGAFAVLAGVSALVTGVVAPLRLLLSRSNTTFHYSDALSWCRFPGLLSLPAVLLLPGAAEAGMAALSSRSASTTATGRAVGALGVALCIAAPALLACAFCLRFRRLFVWSTVDDEGETGPRRGPVSVARVVKKQFSCRVDALVLVEDKKWLGASSSPSEPAATSRTTHKLLRHYGMFFDVYRGKAPWFLAVELFFAVATSAASGLRTTAGCSAVAWTLALLYSAFAAAFAVIRPHAVRLDRVLYGLVSLAQAAAAVFGAAAIELASAYGPDSNHAMRARTAASFFLSAVSISVGAIGMYELGKVVYQQVKVRQAKRRTQAAGAAGQPTATTAASPLDARLLDVDRLEGSRVATFPEECASAAATDDDEDDDYVLAKDDDGCRRPGRERRRRRRASPHLREIDIDALLDGPGPAQAEEAGHSAEDAADNVDLGRFLAGDGGAADRGAEQRRLLMELLGESDDGKVKDDAISVDNDTADTAVSVGKKRASILTTTEAAARRDQIRHTLAAPHLPEQ